ncbi:hypothetical protein N42HA_00137 [Lactococcus lactis]|nr:hypothetical protein [Lactococcus lactis]
MVQQIVLPIKDSNVLKMVQDTLLDSFRAGVVTIRSPSRKATLLRVSDVMTLKKIRCTLTQMVLSKARLLFMIKRQEKRIRYI